MFLWQIKRTGLLLLFANPVSYFMHTFCRYIWHLITLLLFRLEALKSSNEDLDEFMSSREQGFLNRYNLISRPSGSSWVFLKLIHRDISSAYFILIVDLRERGTLLQQLTYLFFNTNFKCTSASVILEENWSVLTYFTRHYFTGQIILEIILTIQNMEMYYRKPGSLANNNVNCIDFYWYKFNKL